MTPERRPIPWLPFTPTTCCVEGRRVRPWGTARGAEGRGQYVPKISKYKLGFERSKPLIVPHLH